MLDLALLSRPFTSAPQDTNTSITTLSHSRRPAILTYASPLVDTASKISFMPFYVLGWHHEAEKLQVPMMERVQFARGSRNIPGSLRLELHSSEIMQVYKAKVMFRARFTGLRYVLDTPYVLGFLMMLIERLAGQCITGDSLHSLSSGSCFGASAWLLQGSHGWF